MHFQGAFTAIVTPFTDNEVDEQAYRDLIEWQIEQGIDGLVPCGTTGESATLSHEEHMRVVDICVDQVKGRVPVIAGAGSNNTKEAIELTRHAKKAKADGALLITPYYNKPPHEGLLAHFKAVAREVSLPFIVYNVPGRTGLNLAPETLCQMHKEIPEIVGVKEATANLIQITKILEQCGLDFTILSGDDFTVLPTLAVGGDGVISVTSNIAPDKMSGLCKAWFDGDVQEARRLHYELNPLCRAMFMTTNPIPAKGALHLMGRIKNEIRLPLVSLTPDQETALEGILQEAGLL
jgi:4-hydroxy-tetrahydrodipicolinate synthase